MRRTTRNKTAHRRVALLSLLRDKGRDIITFAVCVMVSGGFWLLQKLDDAFETDIVVPLELTGVPRGVVITDSLPSEMHFTIRDRGTNLFHYLRNSSRYAKPITLDFSLYDDGNGSGRANIPLQEVQRSFQQQLLSTTRIQRVRPDTLEFYYNRGIARKLPVKFTGSITTDTRCYLQYIRFTPDSVLVYAPDAMRDTMNYAYIKPVTLTEIDKTRSDIKVGFMHIPGVMYKPATISMSAHVDYYIERTVRVPVTGTNFPAGVTLRTFPAEVSVTYRIGSAVSDLVRPSNFVLAVTYEELLRNNRGKYLLRLKSIPPGVSNVRIIPHEVDYLLETTDNDTSDDE